MGTVISDKLSGNYIDVRDVIERIEELEGEFITGPQWVELSNDELAKITHGSDEDHAQRLIELRKIKWERELNEEEQNELDELSKSTGSRTLGELYEDDPAAVREIAKDAEHAQTNEAEELIELFDFMEELRGAGGGDEKWRGDWYPITLISEESFEDHAREMAEDTGAIDRNAKWPLQHIDWKAAAEELQQDYTTIEIGDKTYYWR